MLMHRERLAQVKAAQRRREEGSLDLSQRFRKIMHRSAARALGRISSSPTALETANRYAEITVRMKEAAMKLCEPPIVARDRGKAGWRDDAALLTWLASL